jgi:RNA polymerase sigma factor (sigma-70 family)
VSESEQIPSADPSAPPALVEHFFRHEAGRLVAGFVRRFGAQHLELIEDSVQSALLSAVRTWSRDGIPENPSAWFTRVTKNKILDELRRARARDVSLDDEAHHPSEPPDGGSAGYAGEIFDDELRMLFICCDPELPPRMQLVLALKLLCAFSTREIAARLFLSEANVQKSLERGRERLREAQGASAFTEPDPAAIRKRCPGVLQVIYLLFNEGYSSMKAERPIVEEMCREALRLGEIVARHPHAGCPEADALMALMLLHTARLRSRMDEAGMLLMLDEQDRSLWDVTMMRQGMEFLWKSGRGEAFSLYHAQAAILAEHCMAPSFEETNFAEIVELYEALERREPSPLYTLNRAIALSEWQGPQAGLALLNSVKPPAWLFGYYLWDATHGELLRRSGCFPEAIARLELAVQTAPTLPEKRLFERKLARARAADSSR